MSIGGNFYPPKSGGGGAVTGDGVTIDVTDNVVSIAAGYAGQPSIGVIGPLQQPLYLFDGFVVSPTSGLLEYTDSQLFITKDDGTRSAVLAIPTEGPVINAAGGGPPDNLPTVRMVAPKTYMVQGTAYRYVGKWAESILLFANTGVTGYVFADLEGLDTVAGQTTGITSYDFPELKVLFGTALGIPPSASVASVLMPKVEHAQLISLNNFSALTVLDLPDLISVGNGATALSGTNNCAAFTGFGSLSGLKAVNGTVNFTSCAFTEVNLDALLVALAALDGTNGTTVFRDRAVTVTGTSAPKGAAGIVAAATLTARGCTVTTN